MIPRTLPLLATLLLLTRPAARADQVVLVAGGEGSPAPGAKLDKPFGVLHDPAGRLVIVEYASGLRAIDAAGKLITLCGDGTEGDAGDNGPATAARLRQPHAIAVGPDEALYVADTYNHRVRRIDPTTGVITTFAGGAQGFSGDNGPADRAQFSELYCIAMTPAGDRMIVTDLGNRRIRAVDMKTRIVTTIAGNGRKGVPADGAIATESPLIDPRAAAMDARGNLYILERAGHALRAVDPQGKIRTVIAGPKDAKSPRTLAGPKHLCIDPRDDSVILADTDHHRVVRWSPADAKLTPVAGTGQKGSAGLNGPPGQAQLNQPHGVYLDPQGRLYISDSLNDRVLRIDP